MSGDLPEALANLKLALFDQRIMLNNYVASHMPAALRATHDTEDIVQDVCFEALRRADQFVETDSSSRSRWMLTIARNRIAYLQRRHKVSRQNGQLIYADDQLESLLEQCAVYERTPSASAASHEAHVVVQRSVQQLAPAHADAIRWRYFEGLSHATVAERTGKTENAVRQLCHYALGVLRRQLSEALSHG